MVVVGTDVHKRTHTFVAVDEVGRKLGEKVVPATTAGHLKALAWARLEFGASSTNACAPTTSPHIATTNPQPLDIGAMRARG